MNAHFNRNVHNIEEFFFKPNLLYDSLIKKNKQYQPKRYLDDLDDF